MGVSRMDIDGPGSGSPEGIVRIILAVEKNLPIPVPIEALAGQLDITDIRELEIEGFEGALITDTARSHGIILANAQSHRARRRFTIAHELGHFLIASHMPDAQGRFLCSKQDLTQLSAREADRRGKMEVQANRFASLLLIPPPSLRAELRRHRQPDLQHVPQLARQFDVSKEAMARAYAEYHDQPIAILVVHEGLIRRVYRNASFPFITAKPGTLVPSPSDFYAGSHQVGVASEAVDCDAGVWTNTNWGSRPPALTEQVYLQRGGYALIMLKSTPVDDDQEDNADVEARWQPSFRR